MDGLRVSSQWAVLSVLRAGVVVEWGMIGIDLAVRCCGLLLLAVGEVQYRNDWNERYGLWSHRLP